MAGGTIGVAINVGVTVVTLVGTFVARRPGSIRGRTATAGTTRRTRLARLVGVTLVTGRTIVGAIAVTVGTIVAAVVVTITVVVARVAGRAGGTGRTLGTIRTIIVGGTAGTTATRRLLHLVILVVTRLP